MVAAFLVEDQNRNSNLVVVVETVLYDLDDDSLVVVEIVLAVHY